MMRGSSAELMTPKLALPSAVPGDPKLAWLNALKNSARNCVVKRSVMRVFFVREKSKLVRLGVRTSGRVRDVLPNVKGGG